MNYVDEMRNLCIVSDDDIILVAEQGLIKIFINPCSSSNEYVEIKMEYDKDTVFNALCQSIYPFYGIKKTYYSMLVKDSLLYDIIDAISEIFINKSISVQYYTENWTLIGYLLVELSGYADVVSLYLDKNSIKLFKNVFGIIQEDEDVKNLVIYTSGNITKNDLHFCKLDKKCKIIIKSPNREHKNFIKDYGIVYEDTVNCSDS